MAVQINTQHQDMVHDVQLDYYGRRLATCSSDTTIKIFDVLGDQMTFSADLHGHSGPVFEIAWGHPKFGNVLASCGFDNRIIIWQDSDRGGWEQIYISEMHQASVNSLSFAPHELGFILASASSDGSIGVISQVQGGYEEKLIPDAHPVGATGVSFAPATPPGALVSTQVPAQPERRLASSGCDNTVKIWRYTQEQGWQQDGPSLLGHKDWVRDVAWCPNLGLPSNTIASGSQDGTVILWCENLSNRAWEPVALPSFKDKEGKKAAVYRVSWNVTGDILAVSDSSNSVSLWKEATDKQWQQITS